jgi:chromosome segregation ATPase
MRFIFSCRPVLKMSGLIDSGISNGFSLESRVSQLEDEIKNLPVNDLSEIGSQLKALTGRLDAQGRSIDNLIETATVQANTMEDIVDAQEIMSTQLEDLRSTFDRLVDEMTGQVATLTDRIDKLECTGMAELTERITMLETYIVKSFSVGNLPDVPVVPIGSKKERYLLGIQESKTDPTRVQWFWQKA